MIIGLGTHERSTKRIQDLPSKPCFLNACGGQKVPGAVNISCWVKSDYFILENLKYFFRAGHEISRNEIGILYLKHVPSRPRRHDISS